MSDTQRLQELADFLKTRRSRLTPADVGLPPGFRRRTPGLRREEVAQLANLSTTWYTFLEQGRDIRVSAQVLENLAQALQLTPDERTHLFMLAVQQPPPPLAQPQPVSSTLQHMIDQLEICPAFIFDYQFDVLAWNEAACALFGDFASMTARERNRMWDFFTNAIAREMLVDWERHAQIMLAWFRSVSGRYLGDAKLTELATDLQRVSPEFRQGWAQHEVQGKYEGLKIYEHAIAGRLELEYSLLQVAASPELSLVVYTPVPDSGTAEGLQKLRDLQP